MMIASKLPKRPHGEIIRIRVAVALIIHPSAIIARTNEGGSYPDGVWFLPNPLPCPCSHASRLSSATSHLWIVGWDASLRQTRAGDHPFLHRPKEFLFRGRLVSPVAGLFLVFPAPSSTSTTIHSMGNCRCTGLSSIEEMRRKMCLATHFRCLGAARVCLLAARDMKVDAGSERQNL